MFGVFDRQFIKLKLGFSPLLYIPGLIRLDFSKEYVFFYFFQAVCYSAYISLLALSIFDYSNTNNGHTFGFWNFGNMIFLGVSLFCNLKLLNFSSSFSFLQIVINFLSTFIFVVLWYLQSQNAQSMIYQTFGEITSSTWFFFFLVMMFFLAVLDKLTYVIYYMVFQKEFVPDFEVKYDVQIQSDNKDTQTNVHFKGVENIDKD